MEVPFFNLKKVNSEAANEVKQSIEKVLSSGWYILGSSVRDFEQDLKNELNDMEGHVIGCNSGTDALVLSLLAAGVGPGDEVITVSHTAIPTISAICFIGAKPIFLEIDPETWLMDLSEVKNKITKKTKAILPVHLYGNMVNIMELFSIVKEVGRGDLVIIEDTAQAQGAKLYGKQAGTLGNFGAFSFYPSKNIGAMGDAGAVYCRNSEDLEKLIMLRNYGQKDRYNAIESRGLNSRLDEIQAAILKAKLPYLQQWNLRKAQMMERYLKELADLPIAFQKVTAHCEPAWHLCVIAVENELVRNELMGYLEQRGIQTLIHYPIPTHQQKAFLDYYVELPITEALAKRIISLPMNTALAVEEQEYVIDNIKSFFS